MMASGMGFMVRDIKFSDARRISQTLHGLEEKAEEYWIAFVEGGTLRVIREPGLYTFRGKYVTDEGLPRIITKGRFGQREACATAILRLWKKQSPK